MRHILYYHKYCGFSWPKEYLDIVMRNGYNTVVLTQENISKFMMRNSDPHIKRYFEYRDEENPHTGWFLCHPVDVFGFFLNIMRFYFSFTSHC
jgi:hypothetical protein